MTRVKGRAEEQRGLGMKGAFALLLSDIDLYPPLTSYHLSTVRPAALIAISIIDCFYCENQPASCI